MKKVGAKQFKRGTRLSVLDTTSAKPSDIDLLRVDPQVVAEQLTLLEEALFQAVDARELLQNAWSKADKETRAPNVLRISANFNRVSYFVTTHVVLGTTTEDRSLRHYYWGQVLKHCLSLNNVNSAAAVGSALQSVPVNRLSKRHLLEVKAATQKALEQLSDLTRSNNSEYRRRMESFLSSGEPAIPKLAVHLTDLTFIEDGNPNFVDDLINMQKRHLVGKQIGPLEKLQGRPYGTFAKRPQLQLYLLGVEGYQEAAVDHLVAKLIADHERPGDGSTLRVENSPYKGNRAEMARLLENEAQRTGEARAQAWKDWFLRYSESGADFMATWRATQAWELTITSLVNHPPTRPEVTLFVDLFGKMMPGAAPYLASTVSVLSDTARTDLDVSLLAQLAECLSQLKQPVLDVAVATLPPPSALDPASADHKDLLAVLRKDRRELPRVLVAVLNPPAATEENIAASITGDFAVRSVCVLTESLGNSTVR